MPDVVLSPHLHRDHAGEFTIHCGDGSYAVTVPRAKHFIQCAELNFALDPDPRSGAGCSREDFKPVEKAGLVEIVDRECEILPGVFLRTTRGHTPGHQLVLFMARDLACS